MNELLRVGATPILGIAGNRAFFYTSGMAIDADGAARAYHPNGSPGLDALGNAGRPGNWWGVVTDTGERDGTPVVQHEGDPAPGFHVSSTSLQDRALSRRDPRRYVESTEIAYVVLPKAVITATGVRLGDLAVAVHARTTAVAFAIFADGGPAGKIGEGSIALAEALAIPSSPRHGGTSRREVHYLFFPGSGERTPLAREVIAERAARLLVDWGGVDKLTTLLRPRTPAGPGTEAVDDFSDVREREVSDRPSADELYEMD